MALVDAIARGYEGAQMRAQQRQQRADALSQFNAQLALSQAQMQQSQQQFEMGQMAELNALNRQLEQRQNEFQASREFARRDALQQHSWAVETREDTQAHELQVEAARRSAQAAAAREAARLQVIAGLGTTFLQSGQTEAGTKMLEQVVPGISQTPGIQSLIKREEVTRKLQDPQFRAKLNREFTTLEAPVKPVEPSDSFWDTTKRSLRGAYEMMFYGAPVSELELAEAKARYFADVREAEAVPARLQELVEEQTGQSFENPVVALQLAGVMPPSLQALQSYVGQLDDPGDLAPLLGLDAGNDYLQNAYEILLGNSANLTQATVGEALRLLREEGLGDEDALNAFKAVATLIGQTLPAVTPKFKSTEFPYNQYPGQRPNP